DRFRRLRQVPMTSRPPCDELNSDGRPNLHLRLRPSAAIYSAGLRVPNWKLDAETVDSGGAHGLTREWVLYGRGAGMGGGVDASSRPRVCGVDVPGRVRRSPEDGETAAAVTRGHPGRRAGGRGGIRLLGLVGPPETGRRREPVATRPRIVIRQVL